MYLINFIPTGEVPDLSAYEDTSQTREVVVANITYTSHEYWDSISVFEYDPSDPNQRNIVTLFTANNELYNSNTDLMLRRDPDAEDPYADDLEANGYTNLMEWVFQDTPLAVNPQ